MEHDEIVTVQHCCILTMFLRFNTNFLIVLRTSLFDIQGFITIIVRFVVLCMVIVA